jgi:membrane-associated phospholipid phosphatase
VLNFAVKKGVGRRRPVIGEHPPLAKAPSKLSFPSAHATSSVAAATALSRVEPRAKGPLFVLAGLICIGRPYLGMHYPSDVVAGAVLGTILGRVAPWLGEAKINPALSEPPLNPPVFDRGSEQSREPSSNPIRSDRGNEEPSTSDPSATSESRGPDRNDV